MNEYRAPIDKRETGNGAHGRATPAGTRHAAPDADRRSAKAKAEPACTRLTS